MEESATEALNTFAADSDICQQLLTRYARSSAAQHRHLCAAAGATRSMIQSSSFPLTPISYFAATITSLSNFENLDADALGALTSLLSIVLPLVGKGEIKAEKAGEAVRVLVTSVEENGGRLGTSGVRAVVKCVGVLLAEFCNVKEWDSISLGFEWLLKFSLDKRPKVRKCALDCLLTVFKSFESSVVSKGSKRIYSLFKDRIPVASEMATLDVVARSKNETMLKPEDQEVLHMLNVVKHVVPYLSPKIIMKILPPLLKILSSKFSVITRHIFDVILPILETSGADIVISNAENIFAPLVSYISLREKNPLDSVLLAATIAKIALGKLHVGDSSDWVTYFPKLIESLAGLLTCKGDVSLQTSTILRELIDQHVDVKTLSDIESQEMDKKVINDAVFQAIESTCATFYSLLCSSSQIQDEHFFSVVSFLLLQLGEKSDIFMKNLLLKLADMMNATPANASKTQYLEGCIGSAVIAMGPEKLLLLVPLSFRTKNSSCSNVWLIPILKKYVVGSSLQFFMNHIAPLAKSFENGSRKVKKSVIGQDLQAYARACWGLFPAFCRRPNDIHHSFEALAKLLIPFIKEKSFMLEDIAVGLQELVNGNKIAHASGQGSEGLIESQGVSNLAGWDIDVKGRHFYTRKTAKKNIEALALYAPELLEALTDVFFESPPMEREHIKGAIKCLASISNVSVTKHLFVASLEKYQLLAKTGEHGKPEFVADGPVQEEENRCLILDFASCIVEGADEDLANLLFSLVKHALQSSNEAVQIEAYQTLSRILESNSSFCSSQFNVVMGLLAGMTSASNSMLLKSRFTCLQPLLIHALKKNSDEENTETFLILNEIILALKDYDEEGRRLAYDALNGISSKLRNSSDVSQDDLYKKLLAMITGYLSGSSPHIKSGVVSALSVFVYNDPGICLSMADVVPTVMELLHSKAIEVIKAVLGFVKVLVSCLKASDLQHFLPEIMDGVIRWSSVSRHHFKAKVVVILEIMIRKCGTAAVKALAPEKYKEFVQGVVENRHGKNSSKDNGSKDDKQQASGTSSTRHPKRKREEESTVVSSKEDGYTEPGKRKKFSKQNPGKFIHRGGRQSEHKNLQRDESRKPQGRGFKKNLPDKNKQKDKTASGNNKGKFRKLGAEVKFSKQKKG
ncbi:uncharacterized protein LOC127256667 isoform X2 [Andrographis paniculata]|uniref:uncharacterized protein LOC127256667 isoform X2 n=1 Tax=Andrographis paniculata TaxID=175694 RepID=UPI0021E6FECC|nr:uncharacterized protein LOC127256667 isoform X2 [Andrographis paniculata]